VLFRERDNLANSSQRDLLWSCGGGGGGGRRPLTSIIEHLRISKKKRYNGEYTKLPLSRLARS